MSLVGGVNFEKSQFNRVIQSSRQPGSAFKPFIYALALENGMTPSTVLMDTPQALGGVDDSLSWKPRNYDGAFKGPMTLRNALEVSRNIPTIRLVQDLGVQKIHDFVKRFHMTADLPKRYVTFTWFVWN
uniref:Transpeptidase n=1 Tax=uncultured Bacteriovorax sp. TaxID=346638 RepID=A0A060CKI9_9BACT|nr:transpeptidase [uncultured Bacteriovorax sp.]